MNLAPLLRLARVRIVALAAALAVTALLVSGGPERLRHLPHQGQAHDRAWSTGMGRRLPLEQGHAAPAA